MINLQKYPIKRLVYKCKKYSLTLFIPPCETILHKELYEPVVNPVLYLNLPFDPSLSADLRKKRQFIMKPGNIMSVTRSLAQVLGWVYEGTDDGFETFINRSYFEDCTLKVMAYRLNDDTDYYKSKGVRLYVNLDENVIDLNAYEFETLYDLLYSFSFRDDIMFSYDIIKYSLLTKSFIKEEERNERLKKLGYYK
jgi:hypothetical protein